MAAFDAVPPDVLRDIGARLSPRDRCSFREGSPLLLDTIPAPVSATVTEPYRYSFQDRVFALVPANSRRGRTVNLNSPFGERFLRELEVLIIPYHIEDPYARSDPSLPKLMSRMPNVREIRIDQAYFPIPPGYNTTFVKDPRATARYLLIDLDAAHRASIPDILKMGHETLELRWGSASDLNAILTLFQNDASMCHAKTLVHQWRKHPGVAGDEVDAREAQITAIAKAIGAKSVRVKNQHEPCWHKCVQCRAPTIEPDPEQMRELRRRLFNRTRREVEVFVDNNKMPYTFLL